MMWDGRLNTLGPPGMGTRRLRHAGAERGVTMVLVGLARMHWQQCILFPHHLLERAEELPCTGKSYILFQSFSCKSHTSISRPPSAASSCKESAEYWYPSWEDAQGECLTLQEVRRRQTERFAAVQDFSSVDTPFECLKLLASSKEQSLRRDHAKQIGSPLEPCDTRTMEALHAMLDIARELLGVLRDQAYSLARDMPQLPVDAKWHTLGCPQLYIVAAVLGPMWTYLRGEDGCATSWGFVTRAFRDSMMKCQENLAEKIKERVEEALHARSLPVAVTAAAGATATHSVAMDSGTEVQVGGTKRPRDTLGGFSWLAYE